MKSELFIECAKNIVDFYNLTQESIGSKNRMEYPEVKEVKPRELVLVLDCSGNYVRHHPTTYSVFEIKKNAPSSHQVFKVREVLE